MEHKQKGEENREKRTERTEKKDCVYYEYFIIYNSID